MACPWANEMFNPPLATSGAAGHAEVALAGAGTGPASSVDLHAEGRAAELLRVEVRAEHVEAAGVGDDLAVAAAGAGHGREGAVAPGDRRGEIAGGGVGIGVAEVEDDDVVEGRPPGWPPAASRRRPSAARRAR